MVALEEGLWKFPWAPTPGRRNVTPPGQQAVSHTMRAGEICDDVLALGRTEKGPVMDAVTINEMGP